MKTSSSGGDRIDQDIPPLPPRTARAQPQSLHHLSPLLRDRRNHPLPTGEGFHDFGARVLEGATCEGAEVTQKAARG